MRLSKNVYVIVIRRFVNTNKIAAFFFIVGTFVLSQNDQNNLHRSEIVIVKRKIS